MFGVGAEGSQVLTPGHPSQYRREEEGGPRQKQLDTEAYHVEACFRYMILQLQYD